MGAYNGIQVPSGNAHYPHHALTKRVVSWLRLTRTQLVTFMHLTFATPFSARDLMAPEPKKNEPRKMLRARAIQIGMKGKVCETPDAAWRVGRQRSHGRCEHAQARSRYMGCLESHLTPVPPPPPPNHPAAEPVLRRQRPLHRGRDRIERSRGPGALRQEAERHGGDAPRVDTGAPQRTGLHAALQRRGAGRPRHEERGPEQEPQPNRKRRCARSAVMRL